MSTPSVVQLSLHSQPHYSLSKENLLPVDGEVYMNNHYFPDNKAALYLQQLEQEIDWQQKDIRMFGKFIPQPRLIAWHGDEGTQLRYSSLSMEALPWTHTLSEIRHTLKETQGLTFNGVFLNYYRNGHDYMGWHRDNERVLGLQPLIVSISLGAKRIFKFRHYYKKHLQEKIELENGSLMIMQGDTQKYWSHCLPKALRIDQPRINLTFRNILK